MSKIIGITASTPLNPEKVPGGGTTIHYYDSLDQVPADLPEGSFVAVPSEGAGGGGTKVIDLTQYVFNGGGSFNDVTLTKFAYGGGSMTNETEISTFWEDVNTNEKVKFVIDASALYAGTKIESDEKSRTKYNGQTLAIETSFLVNTGAWQRATVVFGYDGLASTITVVVEPLVIPS